MELRWLDGAGVGLRSRGVEGAAAAYRRLRLARYPSLGDAAEQVLSEEFRFHPMAIAACRERNHTPRVHSYQDHLFVVIHAPEIGSGGRALPRARPVHR